MNRVKMALCTIILLIAGLWYYWERPLALADVIPQENWVRMEMEQMLPSELTGDLKFEDPPMEEILSLFESIQVTRTEKSRQLDDESFRITFYKEEAWPTVMYVGSTGKIWIAADMQFDDWKHYEGGEGVYIFLTNLSKTLSAAIPVGNS